MVSVGQRAAQMLSDAGVELSTGLTEDEFESVHDRFGFRFNPDHHSLLAAGLPVGDLWPNWRNGDEAVLHTWLDAIARGFIFDALNQTPPFWPSSWGAIPSSPDDVAATVRSQLRTWPLLVPIHGHRFTPAAPFPTGSPVFSIHQTDAIYYGADLIEYLTNELPLGSGIKSLSPRAVHVPFWSHFVESSNSADSI